MIIVDYLLYQCAVTVCADALLCRARTLGRFLEGLALGSWLMSCRCKQVRTTEGEGHLG